MPRKILYSTQTVSGDLKAASFEMNQFVVWKNAGESVRWEFDAPCEEDYEISVCYKSASSGSRFEVQCNDVTHARNVANTGWWYTREKVGVVRMHPGRNEITVTVTQAMGPDIFRVRAIELVATAELATEEAETARAIATHADTAWFRDAGYGLMFHWTSESAPRSGPRLPYAQAVEAFDVERFARIARDAGAGYVLFTTSHSEPHFPAPLVEWERVHPGQTAQRDLVADMAAALAAHSIPLMLYVSSHIVARRGMVTDQEFMEIHNRLLNEIGLRYGNRVAGYWFDGIGGSLESHPTLDFESMFYAAKAGNPKRILAWNFWQFPVCTDWQEYWAGEVTALDWDATKGTLASRPGVQNHLLLSVDAGWAHTRLDTPIRMNLAGDDLLRYVKECVAQHTPVTLNVGIYQDVGLGTQTEAFLQRLRQDIRGS